MNIDRKDEIASALGALWSLLPEDYKRFLCDTDGYEGEVGDGYVRFFEWQDLLSANADYNVSRFMDGFLLIGTDGGNRAFGIDIRLSSTTYQHYLETDLIGMSWQDVFFRATSFVYLLRHISEIDKQEADSLT